MKKKILAVFLSLCMAMSLLPVTALATEESWTEVSTAGELSSALGAGGNIKLTEDITVTGAQAWTVGNSVNVVLDLNNHTISSSYAAMNNYIMVINGGSLTVTDNSAEKGGKIEATDSKYGYGIQLKGNNSSFSLLSGTITTTQETVYIPSSASGCSIAISGGRLISTDDSVLCVRGSDTMVNITGGDLESEGRTGVYISNYGDPDSIVFNMTGGKLIHDGGMSGAIQMYKGATLTIGGTAEITSANSYAVQVQENTILNVQGGTVSSEKSCAISVSDKSAVNVSGGKISTEKASTTSGAIKAEDNATVVITGGSISAAGNAIYADGSSQMNISGESTAISAGENYQSVKKSGKDAEISITGGRFTVGENADNSVSNYIPSGMVQASDGSVVIDTETAVAEVNGVGYTTLAAAVAAAEDGDTITMLKAYDATSEETITLDTGKKVTLDLGGNKLTLSRFNLVQGRLTVKNGSVDCDGQAFNVYAAPNADTAADYTKLVIADDVTINADYGICLFPGSGNAGYNSAIEVYGKIESGGIFVSGNLGNDTSTAGNMVSSNKIPTVTIYDGAVVDNGTEGQGIAMNGLANVTVNGGTVSGSEAIGVKRGTLTVNGGDFNSNGAYVDPIEANNNGTENTGATISITSTYNYAGAISVTLKDGTFTSQNAPAVYLGHSKSGDTTKTYTQGVTLDIQGGTFTSLTEGMTPIYVANKESGDAESYTKEVISGGSFKESVAQYVTSDLKYEANANGTYTYHETLDEALDVSNNVSSVEAAKDGANAVTVTVKNGNDETKITLKKNDTYKLPTLPNQGYNRFQGWRSSVNGEVYPGGQEVTITADTTFTAVWTYIPPANPNYKITIGDMENGTITANPTAAKAGATVTLTATPDEGYALSTLTVTDRFGDAVKVTENADGTYTFTMPNGQVTVKATFVETEEPAPAMPFTDVKEGDWFYEEVLYAYENGLMNGVGDNRFAPNSATTRGMLVTILYRLEGEPAVTGEAGFDDVGDTWYTDAVIWAAANDIVNGIGDNQFGPENTLTREQLVTMLYRYAQNKGYDVTASADLSGYPDAGQIQSWAQEAMTWAVAEGIVEGMDGNLNPAGHATRAQIATILMRFCEGVAK